MIVYINNIDAIPPSNGCIFKLAMKSIVGSRIVVISLDNISISIVGPPYSMKMQANSSDPSWHAYPKHVVVRKDKHDAIEYLFWIHGILR